MPSRQTQRHYSYPAPCLRKIKYSWIPDPESPVGRLNRSSLPPESRHRPLASAWRMFSGLPVKPRTMLARGPPLRRTKQAARRQGAYSIQQLLYLSSCDCPCSWIDYLRLPPPPPPPRDPPPPPPRELLILEEPRELLARALLPPPEEPPKAPPFEPPPEPDDTFRPPTPSPPPPLFESMPPALGRFPPPPEAPARFDEPRSPAPPDARLLAPDCCCRWRASDWRLDMESPRDVPPNLFAVDRSE